MYFHLMDTPRFDLHKNGIWVIIARAKEKVYSFVPFAIVEPEMLPTILSDSEMHNLKYLNFLSFYSYYNSKSDDVKKVPKV